VTKCGTPKSANDRKVGGGHPKGQVAAQKVRSRGFGISLAEKANQLEEGLIVEEGGLNKERGGHKGLKLSTWKWPARRIHALVRAKRGKKQRIKIKTIV